MTFNPTVGACQSGRIKQQADFDGLDSKENSLGMLRVTREMRLAVASLAPFNLHNSRVRRASGFLSNGFFERDASHFLLALSTHPGVASEKALALPRSFCGRFTQADL